MVTDGHALGHTIRAPMHSRLFFAPCEYTCETSGSLAVAVAAMDSSRITLFRSLKRHCLVYRLSVLPISLYPTKINYYLSY